MSLCDELDELQNIIDTFEALISECQNKANKEYIKDCLSAFYHDYNEIYEQVKEQYQKEVDEMNYDWGLMRL